MARTPDWQTAYQAVILEGDNSKLKEEADQAEAEIFRRLLMLLGTAEDVEECKAIQHRRSAYPTQRETRLHRPGLKANLAAVVAST